MTGESLFFEPEIGELLRCDKVRIKSVLYTDSSRYAWWSYMFHSYDNQIELVYLLQGKGILYQNLEEIPFESGNIFLKLPGYTYAEYPEAGTYIKKISVLLEFTDNRTINDLLTHSAYLPVYRTGDFQSLLKEIFFQLYHLHSKTKKIHKDLENQLLAPVLTILELSEKQQKKNFTIIDERVLMVSSYIDKHYKENISLQEVSEVFDISPAYLAKIFKAETGYTINQYIVHCRIGNAEKLLMYEKENNMKKLAICCGFTTVQYFYSTFHRHTLCTPVEYRARYQ